MYIAVGEALSWWEAASDVQLGLFKELVLNEGSESATHQVEKYVKQSYGRRSKMMRRSLSNCTRRFFEGELEVVNEKFSALDQLTQRRNEIAHGHCAFIEETVDGERITHGFYLMPAWNEGEPAERTYRFCLLTHDIRHFEQEVRKARWTLIHALTALQQRRDANERLKLFDKMEIDGRPPSDSMREFAMRAYAVRINNMDADFARKYRQSSGEDAVLHSFSSEVNFAHGLSLPPTL